MEALSLKHPPLLETSLSVDFKSMPLVEVAVRDAVAEVAHDFKMYSPVLENNLQIDLASPHPGIKQNKIWHGGNFKKDDHHVLIVRAGDKGGVTIAYSMVNTYTKWEDFSLCARHVIQSVQNALRLADICRIGVRCIDRLGKPFDGCALRDVVKLIPDQVPDVGDEELRDFFYRDTKFYLRYKLFATLIRTTRRNQGTSDMSYIIDTDVFDFPKGQVDDSYWDSLLPRMRELKDMLFFGAIGEKSLEACK